MLIPKEKIIEAKSLYGDKAFSDIVEYFGLEDSYDEKARSCSCPWHSDKTPSFIWNGKENCAHCFSCNRNYGILDLYMEQGLTYIEATERLFKEVGINYGFGEKGIQTEPNYRYPKQERKDRTNVEKYLELRKISKKTLDYADIQSDIYGNIVFPYYDSNDVLKSMKYRLGRKFIKEKDRAKCWFQKDADFSPLLFNMNRIDPSKPLLIAEGELDSLSVIEAGYPNAVSVPNGCANTKWIEYNWEWLEQFDKIILWFDNDEPGIKARNDVIYRLGTWRTYYIEINEPNYSIEGRPLKDANEILYFLGKAKVLEYINKPFEVPVERVLDLAEAEEFDIESAEGLYTGIKDLDNQIYKLVFGTLNIVTGKSGSGKSIFVNQIAICQALQQGYDVFVFSGELPPPILRNWVEINMIGKECITMKDNYARIMNKDKREQMRNWYKNRILVYDNDSDLTATSILNKMEEVARKCGTRVFLLDNLMMIDLECNEEGRLQAEKDFTNKLINFAKKYNVLVFLVAHPRKTGETRLTKEDIAGSGNIVNLAHTVFGIHRYSKQEKEGIKKSTGDYLKGSEPIKYDTCIDVLKNRITGHLPSVDVYFDYDTYRFYKEPRELWFRYKWNKDTTPLPTHDPNNHFVNGEGGDPFE